MTFKMTRDEMIELAVSNGFFKNDEGTITSPFIEDVDISELLLGFAEDVAAAEREACAKLCEGATELGCEYWSDVAEAIRARGEE
jgi:hypothetical protein